MNVRSTKILDDRILSVTEIHAVTLFMERALNVRSTKILEDQILSVTESHAVTFLWREH